MASNVLKWLTRPRLSAYPSTLTSQLLPRTQSPQLPLQRLSFSISPSLQKRKKPEAQADDRRIKLIRYNLYHPALPRPLRFSRNRSLRHWTIHRAWQVLRAQQREQQQRDLQLLYQSMHDACESLRLMDADGMYAPAGQGGRDQGRLFRMAMVKRGVWSGQRNSGSGVPIEYARAQTEYPAREGWNYAWRR